MLRRNPISLASSTLLLLAVAACSLGTGVTPDCNLDGSAPTCDPPPSCDDGKGGLLKTEECCLARANDEYNLQCGVEGAAGADYRTLCGANASGNAACCNGASGVYATCIGN